MHAHAPDSCAWRHLLHLMPAITICPNLGRWAMNVGDKNLSGQLSRYQLRLILTKYRPYIKRKGDLVGALRASGPARFATRQHSAAQMPSRTLAVTSHTRTRVHACVCSSRSARSMTTQKGFLLDTLCFLSRSALSVIWHPAAGGRLGVETVRAVTGGRSPRAGLQTGGKELMRTQSNHVSVLGVVRCLRS